ncbi:MAG: short-chain dehydrogenase [Proteobacteria bacterium]|nr:MAG: short-chain dehydrogenase [Pseudomonadota bacterium]
MPGESRPQPPYSSQKLAKPGVEAEMEQRPQWRAPSYKAAGKLAGKVALVTGGDSGIGRSVAYLFAREGADVAIVYLPEEERDADETRAAIEEEGRRCLPLPGDLTNPAFCREAVERTVGELGRLDVLVSNAAWQNRKHDIAEIDDAEWRRTFRTNVDAYFHLAKAAVAHMRPGSSIIATSSQAGLLGSKALLDYSATKGAIDAFTKSLAQQLAEKRIRVNAVAPGPVWTPLNPADEGQSPEALSQFGAQQPIGRAAQPEEIAPAYVFFASEADSSFVTGVVLEETGGKTVGA